MSNGLRKIQRRHVLNDPDCWDADVVPPFFDVESYQTRMDALVGKNRDGKSIVRLIWGPKAIGLYGVPRYWLRRVKDGEDYTYTTIKRWYLEKRIEREQYFDSWQASRYQRDPDSPMCCLDCGYKGDEGWVEHLQKTYCPKCVSQNTAGSRTIDKGEPPEDFYVFAWMCANHEAFDPDTGWPQCCERADKDGHKRCFGEFRNPNNYDLECISAGLRRRDDEEFVDPYAKLSVHDLAAIEMSSGIQVERAAQAAYDRAQEILRNERVLSDVGGSSYDIGSSYDKQLIVTPN